MLGFLTGHEVVWLPQALRVLCDELPDVEITVVHRSDGSGTTFIWVNYLSKVSPEWKQKVGEGTSVAWPAGVGGMPTWPAVTCWLCCWIA